VRWRSNASDAESSVAVRTISVSIPETLGGGDGLAGTALSEVAPVTEDELSRTSVLDVRSSEAWAEFRESAVAAAAEREVSFGSFEPLVV
jgi:hypothetical protein